MIVSINPATGERLREYRAHTREQAGEAAQAAARRVAQWRRLPVARRVQPLATLAGVLRERREPLARLMAHEMGKPVQDGRAEVEKCAWVCEFYAEHAERYLRAVPVETDASRSDVAFEPLGVVLAVMPWNFPPWQVFRAAVPTLAAGNGMLLKHASNVPGCALEIEAMIRAAGVPEGLFASLLIEQPEVEGVIRHGDVAAVTLTGSTAAGRAVASIAGAALKK